jgi:hypothetical protein
VSVDPSDDAAVLDALQAVVDSTEPEERGGVIDARLIRRIVNRLVLIENCLDTQLNRAAIVDTLPANAPLGALIRLQGDLTGALYMGNGGSRPLTKLLPVAL